MSAAEVPEPILSERILLHLDRLGRLSPYDVAQAVRTQRGMARVLGCPQSTLSRALTKLTLAGVVSVERRHVPGEDRRVMVYSVTWAGAVLARELRPRPSGAAPGPLMRSDRPGPVLVLGRNGRGASSRREVLVSLDERRDRSS